MVYKFITILLCASFFARVAHASEVLAWDLIAGESAPSEFTANKVMVRGLDSSEGLNTLTRTGLNEQVGLNQVFSSEGWNTSDSFDPKDHYIGFRVKTDAEHYMTLASLDYRISGGKPSPSQGRWGYSQDGGKTWTLQEPFEIPENLAEGSSDRKSWDFLNFEVPPGATVEFRFWAYGSTNIAGRMGSLETSNVRICNGWQSDLILHGSVYNN